jgi:hypothetical protein
VEINEQYSKRLEEFGIIEQDQNILAFLSGSFGSTPVSNSVSFAATSQANLKPFDDTELLALISKKSDVPSQFPEKVRKLEVILESDTEQVGDEFSDSDDGINQSINIQPIATNKAAAVPKSKFIEGEAEVEEDEFMNYGGIDGEDVNAADEYEKDMLADGDKSKLNEKAVVELHR